MAASEPRGFTVSPAFQDVEVAADKPSAAYELQIKNHTDADQSFRLSLVDFGSLNETGGVAFLGTPASELEHRYGLASWMTLEKDLVVVPAGGSERVVVTITNRSSLAPGGHYGAVLATVVTNADRPSASRSVGVKQVLSALILATKVGGAETGLRLSSQTAALRPWQLPGRVEHRFQNTGNVHVVPRGVTEVRDMTGRVVIRGALNEQSGVILPESFRRYSTSLIKVATAWMPGRYQLVTTYRYDGTDETKQLVTSFWYAGMIVVWLVFGGAMAAIAGLAWWLFWRRPRRRSRG
jgi:hypothetical protein